MTDGMREAAYVLGADVRGGGESMGCAGAIALVDADDDFVIEVRAVRFTSVLNWSSGRTARKGTWDDIFGRVR